MTYDTKLRKFFMIFMDPPPSGDNDLIWTSIADGPISFNEFRIDATVKREIYVDS